MKRIKLADVARIAGVSTSTVDRVLNSRPGVRPDTVEKVEAAMRQLGYAQTSLARALGDMPQTIAVFLPGGGTPALEQFGSALRTEARLRADQGVEIRNLAVSPFGALALTQALDAVGEGVGVVITVLIETPEVAEAVARLVQREVRVVAVLGDAPESSRAEFIGIDSYAAGRTAGGLMARFLPPAVGTVALLAGDPLQRAQHDRRSGFEQTMMRLRPEVSVVSLGACRNDPAEARRLVLRGFMQEPAPEGLYVIGDAHAGVLNALDEAGRPKIPVIAHELTPDTRRGLTSGVYTALVAQDMSELARLAFTSALRPDLELPAAQPTVILQENLPPE